MTVETRQGIGGGHFAGLLLAPVRWAMNLIDRPMSFVQRRFGLGGVAAAFLAPNMLVFGIFVLFPMTLNVAYSFTGGGALFLNNRVFVGTLQYETLLACRDFLDAASCREDRFWRAVGNTGFFVVVQVTALVLVSLATALVLNREMRARGFWRAVFFFPVLLSPVVVALIWKWILQRNGLLNAALLELGFEPVLWLVNRGWAMFWAIFLSIWAHLGFYTLILLAGLQAIPRDLYEAAEMDGAPRWRVLTRITLPLLWPNMVVVILLALIRAVQVFDEVFVLTGGGPGTATLFLVQYIYETGLAQQVRNLGLASAASILMAVVLIVLTLIQLLASAWRERKEQR
ncbi:carbohydrate ABC transporter permease [Chelativorans xinjiangense]|uniref:carbohydrate ABC transporter permease n=1 Tax=Chelativorans xinjiangense TaxID=2681485 RepID=UPI0013568120|nr:sugar ABC transporter permease [Chelativorans xinjiangense]